MNYPQVQLPWRGPARCRLDATFFSRYQVPDSLVENRLREPRSRQDVLKHQRTYSDSASSVHLQ